MIEEGKILSAIFEVFCFLLVNFVKVFRVSKAGNVSSVKDLNVKLEVQSQFQHAPDGGTR